MNVGELRDLVIKTLGVDMTNSGEKKLSIDLGYLGYEKLLGRGNIDLPLSIKIYKYTSRALEKVEAAGGQIVDTE